MKYQVRVEFNLTNIYNNIKTVKANELEIVKNKFDIHSHLYKHITNHSINFELESNTNNIFMNEL